MRCAIDLGEVILVDSACLGSSAGPWIARLLQERVARKGEARAQFVPSLAEALWELETSSLSAPAVVVSHLRPSGERDPHAYFGQRWGLEAGDLLKAMSDEGSVYHEHLPTPDQASQDRLLWRCAGCAELLLTVPGNADAMWLEWALSLTRASETSAWACRDAREALAHGGTTAPMRCSDAQAAPGARWSWMCHAAPDHLCADAPAPIAARALWASPSPAFAACFGIPCVRDGRALHGLDLLAPHAAVTVSADRDAIARDLACADIFMHRIRVPPRQAVPAGACPRLEFLLDGPVEISSVERMRAADAVGRWRVRIEHPEPQHAGLFAECLGEDVWHRHFGCSRGEVEQYVSLRRSAAAWLPDATCRSPSSMPLFEPALAARLLRRAVLPEICALVQFPGGGHGERHSYLISHLALLIAVLEDIPPLAPAVAGALHDVGRRDDAADSEHPARGAGIARCVVPGLQSAALPESACAAVLSAIATHSQDGVTSCPVSAALRDADRLPLAWERGHDARHFSTGAGHALARGGPPAAERLFRERFGQCLFDTVGFTGGADARR